MSGCVILDSGIVARKNGKRLPCEVLQAENAKLRELIQDIAEHIREDDGFGLDYGWMLDRMQELGVKP